MLRISLTSDDFRDLVAGKIIDKSPSPSDTSNEFVTKLQICLQDIGFDRMKYLIAHAEAGGMETVVTDNCPCGGKSMPIHDRPGWVRCNSCGKSYPLEQPAG